MLFSYQGGSKRFESKYPNAYLSALGTTCADGYDSTDNSDKF
jgi:hypothetical protein